MSVFYEPRVSIPSYRYCHMLLSLDFFNLLAAVILIFDFYDFDLYGLNR